MSKKYNKFGNYGKEQYKKKQIGWNKDEWEFNNDIDEIIVKIKRLQELFYENKLSENDLKWKKIFEDKFASGSFSNNLIKTLNNILNKYKK